MNRTIRFALLSALSSALVACSETSAHDPRTDAPLVRTALVEAATPATRSFTGTVAARVQSDLGFRVAGKVLQRSVDVGQSVTRGQLLMRIDPVDLKLTAVAEEQAVAAARARALQAAQDEARYRHLVGTGAVSASAYDQAKAAADAANAQLAAANAQADVARNASRYAELLADGDGVVMETLAEPGQVVGAGQAVVRLAHAGPREAVIQLPETLRPAIGSVGEASICGKDGARVPVKLRQLSDSADRFTRTFEARYVLEGELASAPLGMTVSVALADGASVPQGSAHVPIGALFDAGNGVGVWVVNGAQHKVSWRPVTVLHLDNDAARVSGALERGERVVALGAHLLREGEQVRVAANAAEAPKVAGLQP
jgi:RND family efflux transporter MFP subunit